MRTKQQLPQTSGALTMPISSTKAAALAMVLRACRLQFQNPTNFEVVSVYLTRTDARRYRAKIFKGGKCEMAQYVEGDDFLDVLRQIQDNIK